ncbi:MAG TPA: M50 family metallopeptidase [Longimicrobiales bacterium]|jgi:hypothetical protein|nr:M50 family metallopeptidase [Longimicrobiales bacterium]
MTDAASRKLRFLAGFAVYFGALWLLWDTVLVYPLKIFVVLLHEVSHAAAAVATGGAVERITLDPNQGGATYTLGGSRFVTLSAGYLGSLAWGSLMVVAARGRRIHPDLVNGIIGGLVVALTAFFVRNLFGIAFGVLFGAALVLASRKLSLAGNRSLLLTLGMTSSLYAILDIKSDVLDRPHLPSDAHMLAELTGIPTLVWGLLWIGLALWVTFLLLRRAWREA